MIKQVHITILLLLALMLFSCKKIRKLKEFDLYYTQEFFVPANNGGVINLPFNLNSQETTTNSSEEYDSEGTASKLVESVVLTKLIFNIKSPANGNFDFLSSVEIYISSPNNGEIIIAHKYSIPETGLKNLEMDVDDSNLKNFLQDDSYKIRVKAITDHNTLTDITILSEETFHVKARLRNVFKR